MKKLIEYKQGNYRKYSTLCKEMACDAKVINPHDSIDYWELKAKWDSLEGDVEAKNNSLIAAAETWVYMAELSVNGTPPSFMTASGFLEKALAVCGKTYRSERPPMVYCDLSIIRRLR